MGFGIRNTYIISHHRITTSKTIQGIGISPSSNLFYQNMFHERKPLAFVGLHLDSGVLEVYVIFRELRQGPLLLTWFNW